MTVASKRKRDTGPDQATRDLVWSRDRGCVVCGETYDCQLHHRAPRKMGGTRRPEINSPANLVVACAPCHEWLERHREMARDRGLLVTASHNPAQVALIRHGVWCLLDDAGGVTPCKPPS